MTDKVTAQEDSGHADYLLDDAPSRTAHLRALDARMRKTRKEIKEAEAERQALLWALQVISTMKDKI